VAGGAALACAVGAGAAAELVGAADPTTAGVVVAVTRGVAAAVAAAVAVAGDGVAAAPVVPSGAEVGFVSVEEGHPPRRRATAAAANL
jgi:hypothetical protein